MKKLSVKILALSFHAFSALMFCAVFVTVCPAQTFEAIFAFDRTDGAGPGSLIQGTDGSFYGTTNNGGTYNRGTIFKISPQGQLITLHNSCSLPNCGDGEYPNGLVQGTDGAFYGTAVYGGDFALGIVFRITSDGTFTTLHSFSGKDGLNPVGTLIQASDGNFYGTTNAYYGDFVGTVFTITPQGDFTTLHTFCALAHCRDGKAPTGALVQATDGNLYGTTDLGGAYSYGSVFRITLDGTLTTLHSFDDANGANPNALVQASDGNFYGTTHMSADSNSGTVFKVTSQGDFTTLYTFCSLSRCVDGFYPSGGLVQASDGKFYGTTNEGGKCYGCGTVFNITTDGTLTTLHDFAVYGGAQPTAGLLQATNGNFYGSTSIGGPGNDGTLFVLSVGLGAFVKPQPGSGKVGTNIVILGNHLTGATSVTFNGTQASYVVVSDNEIETSVPQGATSGSVHVSTPTGTLKSNVAFRVTE